MNLLELKTFVDNTIEKAKECGEDPSEVDVSIQIDISPRQSVWAKDIELIYDGNVQASGCIIHGWCAKRG